MSQPFPLIAVDIGNNRMKFGRFAECVATEFPEPEATVSVDDAQGNLDQELGPWAEALPPGGSWWIGSVNRPATTRLVAWIRNRRPHDHITLVAAGDLPLRVALPRPDMVGIDRLLDAVAANLLRSPAAPAVVVDVGSAITVDLVSTEGAFLGGAILPGIAMSARALHDYTDLLPRIEVVELAAQPSPLGNATIPAMRSGLFWGTVGGIRLLIELLSAEAGGEADVLLTGGASPLVATLLGRSARHVPHLTLAGLAITAAAM